MLEQVNDEFEAKEETMKLYVQEMKKSKGSLWNIWDQTNTWKWNTHVDPLATLVTTMKSKLKRVIFVSCLSELRIMGYKGKDQSQSSTNSSTHTSWLASYLEDLIHNTLPENKDEAHKIMKKQEITLLLRENYIEKELWQTMAKVLTYSRSSKSSERNAWGMMQSSL